MNKIHVLADEVARKIAAGEVVERPVSVVKELVENSLDAGAAEIAVELQAGGKELIRVRDDGSGMSPDDAALCFRRHSTSKIAGEDDLERIATLGFRGEALASISSVSRVTLKTQDGESGRGMRIDREGEKLTGVIEVAFPRGTTVEVRDIFFNLPARRKFLRSDQSELSLIAKYLTQTALAFPAVRFILDSGKRRLLDCPPVKNGAARIFQLFGKDVLDRLMEVRAEDDGRRLDGWASLPLTGRSDRSVQYFFVNGRPVKDRTLLAAVGQAYSGILEKGRFPECFLFVGLPYDEVDVNVHPAKTEVRFRDSQAVFRLVLKAVEAAVGKGPMVKSVRTAGRSLDGGVVSPEERPFRKKRPEAAPFLFPTRREDAEAPAAVGEEKAPEFGPRPDMPIGPDGEAGGAGHVAGPAGDGPAAEGSTASTDPAGAGYGPVVLGQYANLYIIASSPDGLLIIDQHNAHERVLYEKFLELDKAGEWPRKMLLVPVVFDLSPDESVKFDEKEALLSGLGFRADLMGGRTLALKEYPDIFGPEEARDAFVGLLGEPVSGDGLETRKHMLATMACHSAVKAGQPLTFQQMAYLVAELLKTSQPALCPHGRPVLLKMDKSEIERGLGRPVKPKQ